MSERLLLSKREAAAMLGLSVRTLENLLSLKELPARRIGRRCLIERQALERFARRDHRTKQELKENGNANQSPRVQQQP
jgi:excisionase family DNA binding protein